MLFWYTWFGDNLSIEYMSLVRINKINYFLGLLMRKLKGDEEILLY
jgi:hypothetical protein